MSVFFQKILVGFSTVFLSVLLMGCMGADSTELSSQGSVTVSESSEERSSEHQSSSEIAVSSEMMISSMELQSSSRQTRSSVTNVSSSAAPASSETTLSSEGQESSEQSSEQQSSSAIEASSESSVSSEAPVLIDQCNTTAQCKDMFGPEASDCKDSASDQSYCMCGMSRCDESPVSSESKQSSSASSVALVRGYLLTDPQGTGTFEINANDKPHPKPANIPLGEVKTFNAHNRRLRVYLPAGYQSAKDLALMIYFDGSNFSGNNQQWAIHYAMDVLIHNKEMPKTVGIFIDPADGKRTNEYARPNQPYTDVVLDVIETVKSRFNVDITDDPGMRGIAGHSAGGSAAFWMVWKNTDQFSRVFASAGMFNTSYAPYLDWAKKGDRTDKVRLALLTVIEDRARLYDPLTKALDQGGYLYYYVKSKTGEHSYKTVRGEGKRMLRWLWLDWAKRNNGNAPDIGNEPNTDDGLSKINPVNGAGNVKTLFTGGEFAEGPAWIPTANVLIFSDIRQDTTYRLTPPDTIDVYLKPNNSANGAGWDASNEQIILNERNPAGMARGQYGGTFTTFASEYNGKKFNTPNDNVVRSDGTIYFSDLKGRAAYWIDTGDNVHLIADDYAPNGIGLSPDEKFLYITAKTLAGGAFHVWRYSLAEGGKPSNKTKLITLNNVSDGIAIDDAGNIYTTTKAGLEVFKPNGKKWGVIKLPSQPSNAAFGGEDRKTLYVTSNDGKLFSLRMPIAGKP